MLTHYRRIYYIEDLKLKQKETQIIQNKENKQYK